MNVTYRQIPHRSYEYEEAVQLRREVLRLPLGLDFTQEELDAEAEHLHLVGISENKVVACLVLEPKSSNTIKMRQVAVSPERQGEGIGAELVKFTEKIAQAYAYGEITLNARANVVPFYLKLGYEIYGEPFEEVTIPHHSMKKLWRENPYDKVSYVESWRGKNVLVAWNDGQYRPIICNQLKRWGFNVIHVKDARQVWDKVKTEKFDVALIFCILPYQNGFELIAQLRATSENANLPILLLSPLPPAYPPEAESVWYHESHTLFGKEIVSIAPVFPMEYPFTTEKLYAAMVRLMSGVIG